MSNKKNIFEIYMNNGCQLGFYVTRDSWSNNKIAKVVALDGVTNGQPIEGDPPYFNRIHPSGHEKAGYPWQRDARLEADWFQEGYQVTTGAGCYSWTRAFPQNTDRPE